LIGRHPQPSLVVDAGVVGAGEPAIHRGGRIPQSVDPAARIARVAAANQDLPGEAVIGVVAAPRLELDDVPEQIFGTRVRLVDLVVFPLIVVGENDIDLAVGPIRLNVLRPIHARGAEEVSRTPRVDQHLGLRFEP